MIDVDIEQQLGAFHLAVKFSADAPIVGLFGRSGAGKTSVINAIAGITTPARGHIRINDVCLFDACEGHRSCRPKNVGSAMSSRTRCCSRTWTWRRTCCTGSGCARLRIASSTRRGWSSCWASEHCCTASPRCCRVERSSGWPSAARLLAQPRILLMDEPLASLDIPRKSEILDYVERLRDELAIPIVYVSHSVAEISRVADTVVVLSEGKCVAVGDVDEVMGRLDLRPATGRYEAGSLIETRVAAHDADDQLTTLAFDGGELIVPQLDAPVGERVRARIRARDVSLATQRPDGISILNVLPGCITVMDAGAGPIVDVQLAVGGATNQRAYHAPVLQQLDIHVGQNVYALVKAVSFDRRSVGYA